jgi:hypothetical protein
MSTRKLYQQEIRNFKFTNEKLRLKRNDTVAYTVGQNNQSQYSSLYKDTSRFFIIYVEEHSKESPPLFFGDSFAYHFREEGLYTIYCLNYPKIRQQIVVEGEAFRETEESISLQTESLFSQADSDMFDQPRSSLFLQSEESSQLFLTSNLRTKNISDISECLKLLQTGSSVDGIKERYADLFDETPQFVLDHGLFKDLNSNIHLPPNDKVCSIHETRSENADLDAEGEPIDPEDLQPTLKSPASFEDMYHVYKINRENPDSLFSIFTNLKRRYEREVVPENTACKVFGSLDDLAHFVHHEDSEEPEKVYLPRGHKPRAIKRAFASLQARFKF